MTSPNALTVVVPTYNHAHFLPKALDSLLAQTRPAKRVIVIDDGSTDDTAAVLAGYEHRLPGIEVVRLAANGGVVAALNLGLRMADSEFITFLAADDTFSPLLFERVLPLMGRYPAAALCGVGVALVDQRGVRRESFVASGIFGRGAGYVSRDGVLAHLMSRGELFHGNGTVYRTGALRRAGGFDPELRSFCDGYLIQRLALESGVCHVPEVLATWLVRDQGYARSNLADAGACLDMLKRVAQVTAGRDRGCFPPAYRDRLMRRLGYWGVISSLWSTGGRAGISEEIFALSLPGGTRAFLLARKMGKRRVAAAVAAILFRPWDIFPAFLRRMRASR